MSEDTVSFTWPLGDNSDCDLCGFTWNEVGLDLWDEEENIWQLNIRVGCYEGDSVMSDSPEWDAKSADIIEQALMYSEFNEKEADHLQDKLKWIKERGQ